MSTPFERVLQGWRFVEVRANDSLQAIALREMGDAGRWAELITINELRHPYLTTNPDEAQPGVLLAGQMLRVPAPTPYATVDTDPDAVFFRDVALVGGRLVVENGDIQPVGGLANLRQAIRHLIATETGELMFHPGYGCNLRRLLGSLNGPTAALLAARYVRTALEADERVDRVTDARATVSGDKLMVEAEIVTVAGRPLTITEAV